MKRLSEARDMLSGHLMFDPANAVSAGIDRLETQAADIARLREGLGEITPEMIRAGEDAIYLNLSGEYTGARECAEAVFRAMTDAARALSPNPTSPARRKQ